MSFGFFSPLPVLSTAADFFPRLSRVDLFLFLLSFPLFLKRLLLSKHMFAFRQDDCGLVFMTQAPSIRTLGKADNSFFQTHFCVVPEE